jgi:hypothetical protein
MLITTLKLYRNVAVYPDHHVIAKFVRCAEAWSMSEGRAERAVEARRMRCEEHGRRRAQRETRTRDGRGRIGQSDHETADVIVQENPDIKADQIDVQVDALIWVTNRCPDVDTSRGQWAAHPVLNRRTRTHAITDRQTMA